MPPEERLVVLALALEEALGREAWEEADDLFAARAALKLTPHAFPREVDDIDARILARLERGQAEILRETHLLGAHRRATAAYASTGTRGA